MRNSIDKIREFIAEYPITYTCSAKELNKFSQDIQKTITELGIAFLVKKKELQ